MRQKDAILTSLKQVDFSRYKLPACVIYNDTTNDYPGKFLVRVYEEGKPTNIIVVKSTLQEICDDTREYFPGVTFIPAAAEDDPVIIGVYM